MVLRARTIVAIDDSAAILTFLRISLELQGALFYGATTAVEGLAICRKVAPDLVILDLGLPDRDGLEILPDLRQVSRTPPTVIVLTVRREQTIRQQALALGAEAYLTKPFLMDELLDVMQAPVGAIH